MPHHVETHERRNYLHSAFETRDLYSPKPKSVVAIPGIAATMAGGNLPFQTVSPRCLALSGVNARLADLLLPVRLRPLHNEAIEDPEASRVEDQDRWTFSARGLGYRAAFASSSR